VIYPALLPYFFLLLSGLLALELREQRLVQQLGASLPPLLGLFFQKPL
jgi:hypothetical protein